MEQNAFFRERRSDHRILSLLPPTQKAKKQPAKRREKRNEKKNEFRNSSWRRKQGFSEEVDSSSGLMSFQQMTERLRKRQVFLQAFLFILFLSPFLILSLFFPYSCPYFPSCSERRKTGRFFTMTKETLFSPSAKLSYLRSSVSSLVLNQSVRTWISSRKSITERTESNPTQRTRFTLFLVLYHIVSQSDLDSFHSYCIPHVEWDQLWCLSREQQDKKILCQTSIQ